MRLTTIESRVLAHLLRAQSVEVESVSLLAQVWGTRGPSSAALLRTAVRGLQHKLDAHAPGALALVQTTTGVTLSLARRA